jgi:outer membrane protein OmpA-like peptidoglycan-associated protein
MKTTLLLILAFLVLNGMTWKESAPLTIHIPEVYFEPNSTQLSSFICGEDFKTDTILLFDTLATIINETSNEYTFQVAGNTDFSESNELAIKRAEKVKRLLTAHGADPDRLSTIEFNHTRPKLDKAQLDKLNPQEETVGRQCNMRVTLLIMTGEK